MINRRSRFICLSYWKKFICQCKAIYWLVSLTRFARTTNALFSAFIFRHSSNDIVIRYELTIVNAHNFRDSTIVFVKEVFLISRRGKRWNRRDLFVVFRNCCKNERLPNELITNFPNMADDDNILSVRKSRELWQYGRTRRQKFSPRCLHTTP